MDKPEVSHYQQNDGGEPIEYIKAQGWLPDFASANIIKYVSRARYKGQALSDYKKARQYLDWLIEAEEEKPSQPQFKMEKGPKWEDCVSERTSSTPNYYPEILCAACAFASGCCCKCDGCFLKDGEEPCKNSGCEC